ncbi:MAG TPA: GtrA family protein [Acidimicrobiia bacterium]|nr:GtrA family protein [Acidimicrobiia bacterium]
MIVRAARCLCVSVGTTVLSAVILVALALGAGVPAGIANVIAVVAGIVPSYLGNRRWAWNRPGRGSLTREVVPFWVLSLTGLAISTFTVARVATLTESWAGSWRAIALPMANLSVFAALWVVQFVLLDRVIFRTRGMETCPAP